MTARHLAVTSGVNGRYVAVTSEIPSYIPPTASGYLADAANFPRSEGEFKGDKLLTALTAAKYLKQNVIHTSPSYTAPPPRRRAAKMSHRFGDSFWPGAA